MKRGITAAVGLLLACLLPASTASAAGGATPHTAAWPSAETAHLPTVKVRSFTPEAATRRTSDAPARQTADSLRLPDSAFAPAPPPFKTNQVADNATAHAHHEDATHTKSFDSLGRTTGWYTDAYWTAPDGGVVDMNYLASVYPSAAAATAAVEDARISLPTTNPGHACISPPYPTECLIVVGVTATTFPTVIVLRVFAIGNCTAEIEMLGPKATIDANQGPLNGPTGEFTTVSHAAVSALTAACSAAPAVAQQPTLSINGMGVYHKVKGKVKLTSVLKLKEGGLFVATYIATNATGITPSAMIDFIKGGKTVAHADMTAATLSDGTPYFYTAGTFAKKKFVGRLTARVTITIGTVTNVRSIQFTVKRGK